MNYGLLGMILKLISIGQPKQGEYGLVHDRMMAVDDNY